MQLSGAEKPPAGEPENTSSAAVAGTEAPADGGSKVRADGGRCLLSVVYLGRLGMVGFPWPLCSSVLSKISRIGRGGAQ